MDENMKKELTGLLDDTVKIVEEKFGAKIAEITAENTKRLDDAIEAMKTKQASAEVVAAKQNYGELLSFGLRAKEKGIKPADLAIKEERRDVVKAMELSNFTDGGALHIPPYANEIWDLWYPKISVTTLGAQVVPLAGTLTWRKVTAGSSGTWRGEGATTNAKKVTTGTVTMTEKYLQNVVPYTKELIRAAAVTGQVVMNDMQMVMSRDLDRAYIYGTGTQYQPKGLIGWAGNSFASASTTITSTINDFKKLIEYLALANVPGDRLGFIMNPKARLYLETLENTGGIYYWQQRMTSNGVGAGTILGIPYVETTNMPNTFTAANAATTGGTYSNIILADFAQVYIGQGGMDIQVSDIATYKDVNGTDQSAFANNEIVIKIDACTDMVVRADDAVADMYTVNYGN